MIEFTRTETGRLESLAGYSWEEIKQHMTVYACSHGLTDLFALAQPTEQAGVASDVLAVLRALENSVTFYELPQVLGFLYAKYDFYCHYYEQGMMKGVFRADGPFSGQYEAARFLLEKIVPQGFSLTHEKSLYTRLREHRVCTTSDQLVQLGIYTQALAAMTSGKKEPRRRKNTTTREVLHMSYNHLEPLLKLKPAPGLERIESQKREAWFHVLLCCFPVRFFQEMKYSTKSA
jgi:hypothetical protein